LTIGVIGTLATLLGISAADFKPVIMHWMRPEKPRRIPPVSVWIKNTGKTESSVASRGELFIWLPGEGARHTAGVYEIVRVNGSQSQPGMVSVPPDAITKVQINLLNPQGLYPYLERGDCEITIFFRRSDGSLFDSGEVPFTEEALGKYYLSADIHAK
jgi:hypothetical protein